jgi:Coenzyme PQQ synthesis protein D (PqqD)
VVRTGLIPVVAVLGHFDESDRWRLRMLRDHLDRAKTYFQYVSYAQAEQDCEELASRLLARYGRESLLTFRFTAMPRGGHIVLGLLAYVLDLPRSRLSSLGSANTPLVVVDDCAISGRRFGQFLRKRKTREVIFAPLYSHPDFRATLEQREPRVSACISARDLHDYAPEKLGDGYGAWHEKGMKSGKDCYWMGLPDYLCFAWNEPDTKIWYPGAERVETGWRVAPPSLCLKNRFPPGTPPPRLQIQPEAKGPLRPSAHAIAGELDGQTIVAHTLTNTAVALSEVAGDMWRSIIRRGNVETVVEDLLGRYEIDEATARRELDAFLEDLRSRDLLQG